MGFNSKTQKRKMKLLAALTALTSAIDPPMLMMMSGGMGGGGMDIGSNPILLLQLLKGDSGSSGLKDLLPLMMMSGGMGGMGAGMGAGGMQSMLPLLMLMGDDSDSSWSPKPAAEYAAVCAKITDLAAKSECDNNFVKIYSGCTTSDTTACTYICDAAGADNPFCEADAKTACKAIVGDTSSDSGIDDDLLMIMMMGGMNGMGGGAPGAPGQMDPMMMMSLLGRK